MPLSLILVLASLSTIFLAIIFSLMLFAMQKKKNISTTEDSYENTRPYKLFSEKNNEKQHAPKQVQSNYNQSLVDAMNTYEEKMTQSDNIRFRSPYAPNISQEEADNQASIAHQDLMAILAETPRHVITHNIPFVATQTGKKWLTSHVKKDKLIHMRIDKALTHLHPFKALRAVTTPGHNYRLIKHLNWYKHGKQRY